MYTGLIPSDLSYLWSVHRDGELYFSHRGCAHIVFCVAEVTVRGFLLSLIVKRSYVAVGD